MSTSVPPPVHEQAPPPPPKKKTSTLTIVLAILGGGFLLVAIAVGIGIYAVMSSPEGRAIVGMMGEAVKISAKAQKAPGTKELRAMGCHQAMVMDADDFMKFTRYIDAGAQPKEPTFGEMVTCSAKPWGTPPRCDEVAEKYVSAVGTRSKPFLVTVQKPGEKACVQLFDGSAHALRDFDDSSTRLPPVPEEE